MAIPRFDEKFSRAVGDMQTAADLLRYFATSIGDVQSNVILERIPAALAAANNSSVAAMLECQKDPKVAELALAGYPGAPQTFAAFVAALQDTRASAVLWNKDFGGWLAGLKITDILTLKGVDFGFGAVGQVVYADGFPDALVTPLRQSAGLKALISSLEASGATA